MKRDSEINGSSPTAPVPPDVELAEIEAAGLHEAAEDRRIAALMREPKNRVALERRAAVTERLVSELRGARADLAAAVAERDAAVAEATRARFENERLISAIRSEWMRQTDALKAERDEARREAERLDAALNDAVQSMSDLGRDLTVEGERRDAALAQVERVRALRRAEGQFSDYDTRDAGRCYDADSVDDFLEALDAALDAGDGQP